ncbi:MAG: hypothetical protein AUH74_01675 [Nitrospirae bacterium 13_1_40CM_4_62_6]|nr:MAG: hypothetical protein AUH74_01675 [Nitrospirae bacterium 13_1_40CM_4_62_6]
MTAVRQAGRSSGFRVTRLVVLSLALLGVGCSLFIPKETLYLESAKDRATQEEVQQRLGKPMLVASTKAGDRVWVYQVWFEESGSQNKWGAPGTWCDEYVLTFDKQGVLRAWTHKSEGHGGELMPKYCVTDGFKPAS